VSIDLSPTTSATEAALPLFGPEHDELRATCRRFVDRELRPHVETWEQQEDFPREVFQAVGEAGLLGLNVGEAYGGSGPDPLAQAVWIEELARLGSGGVAADLGAHNDLAMLYLRRGGDEALKQRYLPDSVAGRLVGALAITEPGTGSDVAALTTRARREGDEWLLDGSKVFITNGAWCDYVVVAAKVAPADGAASEDPHGQITLFVVDADAPGFSRSRMRMLGWRTSHTGELVFDGVRLSDQQRLGGVGEGFAQITANFAWERLAMSLGAVSGAEGALEVAMDYARQREAFGRPIAGFQVWRHRFADLATRIAMGRALAHRALRLVVAAEEHPPADGGVRVLRTVAMAKLFTQRMAFEVADECVQVHGGAGYMMEYPAQRLWRDARLGPIGGGTDEIMRQIISKLPAD
jgi:acyl-CoA dehydrogenase